VEAVSVSSLLAFADVDHKVLDVKYEISVLGMFSDLSTLLVLAALSAALELQFFGLSFTEGDRMRPFIGISEPGWFSLSFWLFVIYRKDIYGIN